MRWDSELFLTGKVERAESLNAEYDAAVVKSAGPGRAPVWGAASALALSACSGESVRIPWPDLAPETQTVLLAFEPSDPAAALELIAFARGERPTLMRLEAAIEAVDLLAYDVELPDLYLEPGPVPLVDVGRALPHARFIYSRKVDGAWSTLETLNDRLSRVRITEPSVTACARTGGCYLAANGGCVNPCPAPEAPQAPAAPEGPLPPDPPRLAEGCAPPWVVTVVDGRDECTPPPRGAPDSCMPGFRFDFESDECVAFPECPAGRWPEILPSGELAFVDPAATLPADGSSARPFRGIPDALSSGARSVVLARGVYWEPATMTLAGIEIVGACAAETVVASRVWVEGLVQLSRLTLSSTASALVVLESGYVVASDIAVDARRSLIVSGRARLEHSSLRSKLGAVVLASGELVMDDVSIERVADPAEAPDAAVETAGSLTAHRVSVLTGHSGIRILAGSNAFLHGVSVRASTAILAEGRLDLLDATLRPDDLGTAIALGGSSTSSISQVSVRGGRFAIVAESVARAAISTLRVRDTYGLSVTGRADVVLENAKLEGSQTGAFLSGGSLRMRDGFVRASSIGIGASGGRLELARVELRASGLKIAETDGSPIPFTATIDDLSVEATNDAAIHVQSSGSPRMVELRRARLVVEGDHDAVVLRGPVSLLAFDLDVSGGGVGLNVRAAAEARIERTRISNAVESAIIVEGPTEEDRSRPESKLDAVDLEVGGGGRPSSASDGCETMISIRGTTSLSRVRVTSFGTERALAISDVPAVIEDLSIDDGELGIWLQGQVEASLSRVLLSNLRGAAVRARETRKLGIAGLTIEDVRASSREVCGDEVVEGVGLDISTRATVRGERIRVARARGAGIAIGNDCAVELSDVAVVDSKTGFQLAARVDPRPMLIRAKFEGNERDLDLAD
ncbi:MAG: hypothetical protein HYV07_19225 [Deltaproteobacteria bacterium]|nr:hypothetical protein [Deltaproteobacteria bacterium]